MKKINLAIISLAILIMSCENPIRMETKVHEDGSLDKTIVLEKTDSSRSEANMFGISEKKGWVVASKYIPSKDAERKFNVTFTKSFSSVEAANKELDIPIDTLFQNHASFEKKFRWFYTYIRYSETLRPIDRLKKINSKDYFNLEDSLFISRLPGEGTPISKADSLFLQQLNDKIFDRYAQDALFAEYYAILQEVVKRNTSEKKWLDTLARKKDVILKKLDDLDGDPAFASKLAESLGIPLPKEQSSKDFVELSKDINSRIAFMSFARDGKYTQVIEMPWEVVESNADSVAGNQLYYRPLVTKFSIQEYEMYAVARKLNLWTVIISVLLAAGTLFVLIRSKKSYPS
jgi:hypothetical protein